MKADSRLDEPSKPQRSRVLVVEDTFIVAHEIACMLEKLECDVVGPFARLSRAVDAARDADIDVALLDVNLDGERVFPAADILVSRGIPVAFLTGYNMATLPERYLQCLCLEKPFTASDLARIVEQLLATYLPDPRFK